MRRNVAEKTELDEAAFTSLPKRCKERGRELILTISTPRHCDRREHRPVVYMDETRTSIGLMMAYKKKLSMNFLCFCWRS